MNEQIRVSYGRTEEMEGLLDGGGSGTCSPSDPLCEDGTVHAISIREHWGNPHSCVESLWPSLKNSRGDGSPLICIKLFLYLVGAH